MSQLVLAIEPDLRQAAIVKRIVREKALAEVAVVDSRDAAIETMRTCMPDVLLLSALMSPRDEDELMAHLRTLENASHLQTHTIPQLASSLGPGEERASRGLLSAFRRKKDTSQVAAGCDPDLFADEIRVYLQRAADKKRELQNQSFAAPDMRPSAAPKPAAASDTEEAAGAAESSSWSSPFEWKPASSSRKTRAREEAPAPSAPPPIAEPAVKAEAAVVAEAAVEPEPAVVAALEAAAVVPPIVAEPVQAETIVAEPVHAEPIAAQPVVSEPVVAAPVLEPVAAGVPPAVEIPPPAPVLHVAAHSDTVAADAPVVPAKVKAVETPRPKPVSDRVPKLTGRIQIQDLLKTHLVKESLGRDRLGPLARWARSDAPRAAKGAVVTSDDVRALISSLAVPSAVASVSYPNGCRIRRVRVPVSPEQEGAENSGPVILSKRSLADKHSTA